MPDSTSGGYDTELGNDERFMGLPKEKSSASVFSTNMTEGDIADPIRPLWRAPWRRGWDSNPRYP